MCADLYHRGDGISGADASIVGRIGGAVVHSATGPATGGAGANYDLPR